MQAGITWKEPAQRREPPIRLSAESVMYRRKKSVHGQYAATADQAVDLLPERNEGGEIDDSKEAKEKPARDAKA
jgi:hypothetical protein